MRNGRMSCCVARELSITNMFSSFSNSIAGSLSGKFNGISYQIIFNLEYKGTDNFEISRERMKM